MVQRTYPWDTFSVVLVFCVVVVFCSAHGKNSKRTHPLRILPGTEYECFAIMRGTESGFVLLFSEQKNVWLGKRNYYFGGDVCFVFHLPVVPVRRLMKYFLICGEHSSDLYGARVMQYLKEMDSQAEFMFTGGPEMEKTAGRASLIPLENMNFMGFWEVIKNLSSIRRHFSMVKKSVLRYKPDAILLLDYPGFNLQMAKWLQRNYQKPYYFISPTVWAWKANRAYIIRDCCKMLFCILPFEENVYRELNVFNVRYVGHPMAFELNASKGHKNNSDVSSLKRPFVLLMPGSRIQEVKRHLPVMLSVAEKITHVDYIIAAIKGIPESMYEIAKKKGIEISYEPAVSLMKKATAGLIKSGTSSLQAMLSQLPHAVCYKAHPLSYFIARTLVKVSFISLVNLIPGKEIVKEFIQQNFHSRNLEKELKKLLYDKPYRNTMLSHFAEIKKHLLPYSQHPCYLVAEQIYRDLNKNEV